MAAHEQGGDERYSFEAFTQHPFFTEVNRWIVERVICPGRRKVVDLGCGPGAVTKLILERLDDARNAKVIGIDPSPSALSKARAAIHSRVVEFIEGSAEWVSRLVSSADAVVFLNAIHLVGGEEFPRGGVREFLTADEYADLCVNAGFARPSVELVRIEMPPESLEDIGRFSLFIEGALPGVPLGEGSKALQEGLRRAMDETGFHSVPRNWLECVATAV